MPGRILIVDDDAGFARAIARNLRLTGHDVSTCSTANEARSAVVAVLPDVIVLDYHLPDADGLHLLDELRIAAPGAELLMATAYPSLDVAVEAMRRGAMDYIAKGADTRECLMRIERAAEVSLLRHRMAEASRPATTTAPDLGVLGDSPTLRELRKRLMALSDSDDTTALILGETGTGKSLIARAIHAASRRSFEPFVAVDCTTIPSTLVESELFGHERGAFSGAVSAKQGRVEAAGRGTLFLDEIGELELGVQAKLLRLLEEREFTRVGSTRTRKLHARIITATNRDLARAVEEGRFRADLRYRLEVFVVEVPPLRQRREDVFLLAAHFAQERSRILGRVTPSFAGDVLSALAVYPFPGNVRELRNMVEQAVVLSGGTELTLDDFPVLRRMDSGWQPPVALVPVTTASSARPSAAPAVALAVAPAAPAVAPAVAPPTVVTGVGLREIRRRRLDDERVQVTAALEASGGNISEAARRLGLSRHQLTRRIQKHRLA